MALAAEAAASAAVAGVDLEEDTEVALADLIMAPIIMDLTAPEAHISVAGGSIVHITDEDIMATEAVASVDLWACFFCPS